MMMMMMSMSMRRRRRMKQASSGWANSAQCKMSQFQTTKGASKVTANGKGDSDNNGVK